MVLDPLQDHPRPRPIGAWPVLERLVPSLPPPCPAPFQAGSSAEGCTDPHYRWVSYWLVLIIGEV